MTNSEKDNQSETMDENASQDIPNPMAVSEEDLRLRAKPRPVRRINKLNLFIGIQIVLAILFGLIIWSLSFKGERGHKQTELYNTKRKTKPEGLETLPKSYDQIPKLGPPLSR